MFDQNGLSLDQAPPISVVFRFFLSGALFGLLAGVLVLLFGAQILDAANIEAVILIHTLTLGVMLSFMFAALFQMLPVIAGVKLTAPVHKANLVQYPFLLGVFSLLGAFHTGHHLFFAAASLLLGFSILGIVLVMLENLLRLPNHSASSKGMSVALLSLALLTIFALYLTATLGGFTTGEHYIRIKTAHYSLGLFGWIALLIISISFQVIEMFYVTPPYPKPVSRYLPLALLGLLLLGTVFSFVTIDVWVIVTVTVALLLTGYAFITLKRLTQRKRPIADATVWFWRLGMSLLILSMTTTVVTGFVNIPRIETLGYILFASFALSIVFAMFYKIIPFLTWFHLNAQGYFTAPMMHEVIHPKTAMKHLYIHLSTIVTILLSPFVTPLVYLGGALTILSFGWILWQIIHAWRLYLYTQKTGEKFEMNMGGVSSE